MIKEKFPWISKWMTMLQSEVLDRFHNIHGAFSEGTDQNRIVYIKGTRKDRALLVAHSDTVWTPLEKGRDNQIRLKYKDGILYSGNQDYKIQYTNNKNICRQDTGIGIGADDRAGCGMVWAMRDMGHSILITSGEERGCLAAKNLMRFDWWKEELNSHTMAIEFDRRGFNDAVFYDISTNKYVEYVKKQTGYKPQTGFGTDIKYICKDICGVNLSVGYYREHTKTEVLLVDQWENTLRTAREWLSKELPRFSLDKSDIYNPYSNSYDMYDMYPIHSPAKTPFFNKKTSSYPIKQKTKTEIFPYVEINTDIPFIQFNCPICKLIQTQEEWYKNRFACGGCNSDI